jgi:hypothetical protein
MTTHAASILHLAPIKAIQAVVRWCGDGEFGVQFRRVEHAHEERLQQLVSELPKQACHWCEG